MCPCACLHTSPCFFSLFGCHPMCMHEIRGNRTRACHSIVMHVLHVRCHAMHGCTAALSRHVVCYCMWSVADRKTCWCPPRQGVRAFRCTKKCVSPKKATCLVSLLGTLLGTHGDTLVDDIVQPKVMQELQSFCSIDRHLLQHLHLLGWCRRGSS